MRSVPVSLWLASLSLLSLFPTLHYTVMSVCHFAISQSGSSVVLCVLIDIPRFRAFLSFCHWPRRDTLTSPS